MSKLRKIVRKTLFSRRRGDGIELGRGEKSKLYCGTGDKVCIKALIIPLTRDIVVVLLTDLIEIRGACLWNARVESGTY